MPARAPFGCPPTEETVENRPGLSTWPLIASLGKIFQRFEDSVSARVKLRHGAFGFEVCEQRKVEMAIA
jgi:hypothetical protein